ncbi:MAG: ATP-binding cassette domain-containing protein [Caulobacter sp.]|nr:ATP-binding cassette domain-containing protein [Caulobacter sp.]
MLRVENLVVGRGAGPVARIERLTAAQGEAVLIVGPSGAGKTTALLALAGLAPIHGGQALLGGIDLTALDRRGRDRLRGSAMGFVFQDLHLVAGLSALDNVLLAPFAAGLEPDAPRAQALLDSMGLADLAHRPAERLSRGQAQRVAIARAMLLRPRLILADEPTASLDDQACETTLALLLQAARDTGAALVIATHDGRLRQRGLTVFETEPMS